MNGESMFVIGFLLGVVSTKVFNSVTGVGNLVKMPFGKFFYGIPIYRFGKKYFHIIKLRDLPKKIFKVFDATKTDITSVVESYAGIKEDFSEMDLTPKMLGVQSPICIITADGLSLTFEENETIRV